MNQGRIYTMGPPLTEEQVAVTFAMCSRSPDPFDESAKKVSEARAAEFNEKWVLDYGHASVAEHATTHLAVENVSRVCADHIENGRLSSYTEKSSRYQSIPRDGFHTPRELEQYPTLLVQYHQVMEDLMNTYWQVLDGLADAQREQMPQRPNESEAAWQRRRRRESLDDARSLLPAATLTNLGLTANARSLAYLISRMASSPLQEDRQSAANMAEQGSNQFPSLLRHAQATEAMVKQQRRQPPARTNEPIGSRMLEHQPSAELTVAANLMFTGAAPTGRGPEHAIRHATEHLKLHDQPPREFELPNYLFEVTLDYGAMRELRRHRMMTFLERPLSALGQYDVPESVQRAGMSGIFHKAMGTIQELHLQLLNLDLDPVAQYAVCHAHRQTLRIGLNIRQLRNMARLRTQPKAHRGIRLPVREMVQQVAKVHPVLHEAVLASVTAPEEQA